MLKAVTIENVAVIKKLDIEFDKGFTVLTGETGAGKSIIIDSIAFLLGARSSKEMIRTGEHRADVSGLFSDISCKCEYFDSIGVVPDENGELLLSRYITDDGKSGAKINGKSVSLSVLKQAAKVLLSIHGQHDSFLLSDKNELISLLDNYVGFNEEKKLYEAKYKELCELNERLAILKKSLDDRAMMTDILSYQLKEIDTAKLQDPDEEEKLIKLRIKLRSLEKVSKNVSVVKKALFDNEKGITAVYMMEKAVSAIRNLSDVIDDADELADKLELYRCEVIDIYERVSDIINDEDVSDPDRKLDIVEKRLSQIKKLKVKYGETISEIINKRNEIKSKLSDLENSDDVLTDLENRIKETFKSAEIQAAVLTQKRSEAAKALSKRITEVLMDLDMPKVRFKISVVPRESSKIEKFDFNGQDDIDYLVSPNVGEDMQSISKIASGGELSRIMLAIKSTMMQKSAEGTSVFDEIDAGVSGATSERIGLKLADMSHYTQIICITHSAQIAALADMHLKISKREIFDRVESAVEVLDAEGRVKELSRIIGGIDITEKQIKAALEMLEKSGNISNKQ